MASSLIGSHEQTDTPKRVPAGPRRRSFETRVQILATLLCLPGFVLAAILLWRLRVSAGTAAAALGGLAFVCLIVAVSLHEHIVRPLQTLSNVVAALREDDFSFRARGARLDDSLGELAREINALANTLQTQKVSALEATALLRRVVEVIDAPILAFDPVSQLRLINPAAERTFGLVAERALGRGAGDLHLADLLSQPADELITLPLNGHQTRWIVRRATFRQTGVPHTLLLLSDVSSALREQEREAWQRLVRVLGHELNNSLAPIKSIAGTLRSRLPETALSSDQTADFERGLSVIENRADSLNRFAQAYRMLARLPKPALRSVPIRPMLERVTALEMRLPVEIHCGPELSLTVDPDQLEQLLINLVRNAVDAALHNEIGGAKPGVEITWRQEPGAVLISVSDNGPGITNPSNLFVPFYTTKPGGTGIGLVLARQIAEAHGGSLELTSSESGCTARIRVPARLS